MSEEDADTRTPTENRKRRWIPRQGFWNSLTAITALVALVISADAWIKINSRPDVSAELSSRIDTIYRLGTAEINVKPAYQLRNRTDRLAYIDNVQITLRKRGEPARIQNFRWSQQGYWRQENDGDIVFVYDDYPTPVLVNRDAVQNPVLKFAATDANWRFSEGIWDGSVTFAQEGRDSFSTPFCVDVDTSDVRWMQEHQGFPRRYGNDRPEAGEGVDCYRYTPVQ